MGSYYAVDSVREAADKTVAFFRGPGLLGKWLKIAILLAIVSLLTGGGGGGSFNMPDSTPGRTPDMSQFNQFFSQLSSMPWATILVIALVAVLVLIIIGIILDLIRNMCTFAILESVSLNNVRIFSYLKKFFSLALSLTLFEIVLGIIWIPFGIAWLIVIAGLLIMFFSYLISMPGPGIVPSAPTQVPLINQAIQFLTNPAVLIIAVVIAIVGAIIFLIINYIKGQFAVYFMYRKNEKAWHSFKKCLGLVKSNLIQVFVLILVQIALAIVAGIIGFIVMIPFIIAGIIGGLVLVFMTMALIAISPIIGVLLLILLVIIGILIFMYAFNVIFAPISVFFYYFNLTVLDKFLGVKPQAVKTCPAQPGNAQKQYLRAKNKLTGVQ